MKLEGKTIIVTGSGTGIDMRGFGPGRYVVKPAVTQCRLPQNTLLYIVFGDPALVPFEPLAKTKQK